MFKGHDAILAVDIGGTNIRAGVVQLNLKKSPDLSKAAVWKFELWRHADEESLSRERGGRASSSRCCNKLIGARREGEDSGSRRSSASAARA